MDELAGAYTKPGPAMASHDSDDHSSCRVGILRNQTQHIASPSVNDAEMEPPVNEETPNFYAGDTAIHSNDLSRKNFALEKYDDFSSPAHENCESHSECESNPVPNRER